MLRLIRNRIVEMILDVVEQSHNILFYSIYKLLYISYLSILFKLITSTCKYLNYLVSNRYVMHWIDVQIAHSYFASKNIYDEGEIERVSTSEGSR